MIGNEKTHFKSKGVGTKNKQQPISVMYPQEIDAILRAMPNRSEFIRNAVIKELERSAKEKSA